MMARMVISWHMRSIDAIRRIQDRFGMQRKMTVNKCTPIDIEPRGDDWLLLKKLESEGWLSIINRPMKDII